MPSKDTFHRDNPKMNEWLSKGSSDQERPHETPSGESVVRRDLSAQIQRLAKRLGVNSDELAKKIPPDTIRRTKYPVLEERDEQGRLIFRHDPGISEGPLSEIRK